MKKRNLYFELKNRTYWISLEDSCLWFVAKFSEAKNYFDKTPLNVSKHLLIINSECSEIRLLHTGHIEKVGE